MKQMIRYFSVFVLLLCSAGAFADGAPDVKIAEGIANGTVDKSIEGTTVTLTATPNEGYYLSDIKAVKTVDAGAASRTRNSGSETIPTGEAYTLTKTSSSTDRSQVATYTLDIADGYGAYVTATFAARTDITANQVTLSTTSFTYNGSNQKPTVSIEGLTEGTDYTVSYSETAWKDAGTYTLTVTGIDAYKNTVQKTWTIEEPQQQLTITAASDTKTYDGTALTKNSYTSEGLAESDHIESVTVTGSQTDAGTSENVPSAAVIKNASNEDVTANYNITYVNGTLTVNPANATLTANSGSEEYDGTEKTVTGFTSSPNGLVFTGVSASGSGTNVGDYAVTFSGVTLNSTKDNTGNYVVTATTNGTLTIYAQTVESGSGTTITKSESGYTATIAEGTGNAAAITPSILNGNGEVTISNLDYSRTLTAPTESNKDVTISGKVAKLYTTCLPKKPKTGTGIIYYKLSGVRSYGSGKTLDFTEVLNDEVAANTPYLVAVTSDHTGSFEEKITNATNITLKKTVTAEWTTGETASDYKMIGTLTGLAHEEAVGKYILQAGGKWHPVGSDGTVHIPPFRAYIEGPAAGSRLIGSSFEGEDDATGIVNIRTTDADGTERWYDLNGRRIDQPTKKGIYIRNGKKEIRK